MTAQEIEQKQVSRFILLGQYYNNQPVEHPISEEAISFLGNEGLLDFSAGIHSNTEPAPYKITHAGIKLYEYIVTRPDERTELFPSFNDMGL